MQIRVIIYRLEDVPCSDLASGSLLDSPKQYFIFFQIQHQFLNIFRFEDFKTRDWSKVLGTVISNFAKFHFPFKISIIDFRTLEILEQNFRNKFYIDFKHYK